MIRSASCASGRASVVGGNGRDVGGPGVAVAEDGGAREAGGREEVVRSLDVPDDRGDHPHLPQLHLLAFVVPGAVRKRSGDAGLDSRRPAEGRAFTTGLSEAR